MVVRRLLVLSASLVAVAASLPMTATGQVPDPPECFGREATIVGTQEDDRIFGTEGRDVIVTLGGNDGVDGDPPPPEPDAAPSDQDVDYICLGPGSDHACGGGFPGRAFSCDYGAVRDRLRGGPGGDTLLARHAWGGPGNDVVSASTLDGGPGHRLFGGAGVDHVEGTWNCFFGDPCPDGDVLRGAGGPDFLDGHDGEDLLAGGKQNDELRGGEDPDELFGGSGRDSCFGGGGQDRLAGCEPKG